MNTSSNTETTLGASMPLYALYAFFQSSPATWSLIAVSSSIISYLFFASPILQSSSSKAQRAKVMKQAFKAIENQTIAPKNVETSKLKVAPSNTMQISKLWIYPIKSIRGCPVSQAVLTREGFYLDRRFMLLKDLEETPRKLQNMHVPAFPNMSLFHTEIRGETLIVSYRSPGTADPTGETLEVPLEPSNLESLERLPINMHGSHTTAYDLGTECSKWFSDRFGFKVVLAYWGGNPRPVLGNLPGQPANQGRKKKNIVVETVSRIPVLRSLVDDDDDGIIAFNDCAPYLVINEKSVADVSTRLPEDMEMDHTKFRANIVVKGSSKAFEEDFWGELSFGDDSKIILTGNCARCNSLNVDYNTGEAGKGKDGEIIKLLQKDRRVDPGTKYSPVFGRYGFASRESEGRVLSVGDEVLVSRKNDERTVFYWPGISTA
ncbi:Mitochondrial amidoxime reducing component [Lachnellula hyalina]|uniref:Mitochondrial amidoxime reducing component n=1 Tax=Lachnellula hyalina TaxID=1316788 RepID=A0A8H8R9X3_9HELO|nr:Mitochondrial amidoxime reducing component [Lachnellula hyalina]TVY30242.1 Mitochondrial amidoxime reducing component [Lachnellula hyalina]